LTEDVKSERGERIQVVVPAEASAELALLAVADDRSVSAFCSRILIAFLEAKELRASCAHRECVRVAVQQDVITLSCIDCGSSITMTTDEIRRHGKIVHVRGQKEAS